MFINLCPHPIKEITTGLQLPACTTPIRVGKCTQIIEILDGITIFRSDFKGPIQHLPEPIAGVTYVVSALYLNAVPKDRTDVVCPGNVIKENGLAVACRGFRRP